MGESTPCNVEQITSAFIEAAKDMNNVIADRTRKYHAIYRDLIQRGTFEYGKGYTKYKYVFHGGQAVQDAGASWSQMAKYRAPGTNSQEDPGYDPCRYESEVISYGFEEKNYTIFQASRRTLDVCLTDVQFDWQFENQLALIYRSLANVTLGEWEQVLREMYLYMANKYWAQASATGLGLEPITGYAMFDDHIDVPAAGLGTVGKLTQSILDRLYQYLVRQCPEGAIATGNGGMPVFGLITSMETSFELIHNDSSIVEAMKYASPSVLLEGYGSFPTYKNFAHIMDTETPRLEVSADGTELERVWPYAAASATIGNSINVDLDYIRAPFEISSIFLKDVFKAQVPPANPSQIAGGYTFEPQDNFGDFRFLVFKERCENPVGEKGFFWMRMRMAPEPGMHSADAISIVHRRCNELTVAPCGTCWESGTDAIAIVSCAQFDEDDVAGDATKFIVELESCLPCDIGQDVTVTFTGGQTACARIADDWAAPIYVLVFAVGAVGGWCDFDTGMATVDCECSRPN